MLVYRSVYIFTDTHADFKKKQAFVWKQPFILSFVANGRLWAAGCLRDEIWIQKKTLLKDGFNCCHLKRSTMHLSEPLH